MGKLARSGFLFGWLVCGVAVLAQGARAGDVSVRLDGGAGFSLRNGTGAIERLRVDEATGNLTRNGALFVHTTGGVFNLFVGPGAGNLATTGFGQNVAFGADALRNVTTGFSNTAIGTALYRNTTGSNNTAVGSGALDANTTGSENTAVGTVSLFYNTTGFFNTAVGGRTMVYNTTGGSNTAVGNYALHRNTTGGANTATGFQALYSNTTGLFNTAVGSHALRANTTGIFDTALGTYALSSNTVGTRNVAVGTYSMQNNTSGYYNSAVGYSALRNNQTGRDNAAFGTGALRVNTTGGFNTAVGVYALRSNSGGGENTALGSRALRAETTGIRNTALGTSALYNVTTGNYNVGVGAVAGLQQTTGSDNIYIANLGVTGESGRIRIGTLGKHTQAHVVGIHSSTSAGGIPVLVNASGALGTTTSSARFKEDVRDMGAASDVLMQLRPVVFRYREDAVGAEESRTTQYGLIAEEVAEVAPELVAPDLTGKPYSVKYHELPALLLNEVQAQRRLNEAQQRVIAAQNARIEQLERAVGDR